MKKLILATILITLINPAPSFAQESESPLLITSHEIRIHQTTRDARGDEDIGNVITFSYDVEEKMEIKNTGSEPYTKTLTFVTQLDDDDADELKTTIKHENGKKINCKFPTKEEKDPDCEIGIENGNVLFKFREKDKTKIKPKETIQLNLEYRVYFLRDDYTKPDVWTKEILYPHAKESLVIKGNPVGSADYYFYADPFNFHKRTTESGYWESLPLSPTPGAIYKVMTRKGKRPTPTPEPAVDAFRGETQGELETRKPQTADIKYPENTGRDPWLIALVGINAVLVLAVIVLIVRNRS